jgi:hypothetical protein
MDKFIEFLIPIKEFLFLVPPEQYLALIVCFVLWYIVRSISFIKCEIREIREDEESIQGLITEIKNSEDRTNQNISNLKQSHKDYFKRLGEYMPPYPEQILPEDRTNEILEGFVGVKNEIKDNLVGAKKRSKDVIKLVELARKEIQEARDDNASNNVQIELPKIVEEIQKEQYLGFNTLSKQITNLDINPIVKIPPVEIKEEYKNYEKQLEHISKEIKNINHSVSVYSKLLKDSTDRTPDIMIQRKENLEKLLEKQNKLLNDRLKLMENKIIDNIPSNQTIINTKTESVNIPDFRRLSRDLLLQIEEIVSTRLEELNKKILESREVSTIEIQRTIDQVEKISKIVTNKLLEVKPSVLINNNSEVLNAIKDLEKDLKQLKIQVASESVPVITKEDNSELTNRINEIEKLFVSESQEIKNEVKQVGSDINGLFLRLPFAEQYKIKELKSSVDDILYGMKSMSNNINDIDITVKANQNKVSMLLFNHFTDLKNSIPKHKEPNLIPIFERLNGGFDKMDNNFNKFLDKLSKIPTEGSQYDINPESLNDIKHIFETDIINQYQEQMIFLELLGAKISELSGKIHS